MNAWIFAPALSLAVLVAPTVAAQDHDAHGGHEQPAPQTQPVEPAQGPIEHDDGQMHQESEAATLTQPLQTRPA